MNPKQRYGIILAGLVLAGMSASPIWASLMINSFSGDLAPANWSAQNYGFAPGTYVFNVGHTSLQMSASANSVASDIRLSSSITQDSSLSISWTLNNNGNIGGAPTAYYYVDSNRYNLVGLSGVINNLNLPSGTTLSFELSSANGTTSGKNSAILEFDFMDAVPEAGGWLAGVFLLCFVAFDVYRRKFSKRAERLR